MQIIVLRLTSKMMRKIVPPAQLSGGQDNVDLPAGGSSCQREYASCLSSPRTKPFTGGPHKRLVVFLVKQTFSVYYRKGKGDKAFKEEARGSCEGGICASKTRGRQAAVHASGKGPLIARGARRVL